MKKLLFVFILFAFLLSACAKPTPTPTPEGEEQYRVTKSTGFYYQPDVDSDYSRALQVGQILKRADDYSCKVVDLGGGSYANLCKFEAVPEGDTGWVLAQWVTKNN